MNTILKYGVILSCGGILGLTASWASEEQKTPREAVERATSIYTSGISDQEVQGILHRVQGLAQDDHVTSEIKAECFKDVEAVLQRHLSLLARFMEVEKEKILAENESSRLSQELSLKEQRIQELQKNLDEIMAKGNAENLHLYENMRSELNRRDQEIADLQKSVEALKNWRAAAV